ncbi:YceI family protein [Undibacterium sp. CY7W]|uniref:YceI family protein n=1 Tax=Undibacterium rugosum TaxID=2762291 RepID=A0A923I6Y7_9BURK|nr:YceI family protein [Undibacterium rugosum]MBC3933795.1 YceI family protein [Undibacterium rugosum]
MWRSLVSLWQLPLVTMLATASTSLLAADRYRVDSEHTYSSFEYLHWGLSRQSGRFDKNSGNIQIDVSQDGSTKSGSIDLSIDATSVNTGSDLFDKTLRSASFFDVVSFPVIRFQSDKLLFDGEQLRQVEGQLSIKGITRPVTLQISHFHCRFMLLYLKQACGANGEATVKRSDYDLGRYVPFVSDDITLRFSIEAIRE